MNTHKFFNLVMALIFAVSLLGTPVPAAAQESTPIVVALIAQNHIVGFHWPDGAQVALDVDDPDNGVGIDYTETQTSVANPNDPWDTTSTKVDFLLSGFTLQAGQIITMTDGTLVREHTVTNLTFGGGDFEADTVWGTADVGAIINVVHQTDHNIFRRVATNQNGNWLADFSVAGDELGEENSYDIRTGDVLMILESNGNGHTQIDWRVPAPMVKANFDIDEVQAWGWENGTSITLTIDDPSNGVGTDYTNTLPIAPLQWDPNQLVAQFQLQDAFDILPGHVITVTGNGQSKSMTVANIWSISVDVNADTVSGYITAGSSASVHAGVNVDSGNVPVDENGYWIADLSLVGTDLQPGSRGYVQVDTQDGGSTWISFQIFNPSFTALFPWNRIDAYRWPMDADLTLTIDDPDNGTGVDYTETVTVGLENFNPPADTWASFHVNGFALQPGQLITVTDGNTIKTHVVQYVTVTEVNPETDTITGTATPGAEVQIGRMCDENGCAYRGIVANAEGNWLADLTSIGNVGGIQGVFDIRPGSRSDAFIADENDDRTSYQWEVPNPNFGVRVTDNNIEGWEWPLGSTVTIKVDDPNTGANPDYTGTSTVVVADWDPTQTSFGHNIENYDLKTGDIVKVTDGSTTKQLAVTDFMITNVDIVTNKVYGVADPGQRVNIWTCWQNDPCVNRDETADQNGNWVTNFAVPGEQGWENKTADLRAGSWVDSSADDEDGDQVRFGWRVPKPYIIVGRNEDNVYAVDWPVGTFISLEIDDPATSQITPDFTASRLVTGTDTWENGFELSGVFDIKPDDSVTVSGGGITRQHIVTRLTVTNVDINADTISGTGYPGAEIHVGTVCDETGCASRNITVNSNGIWIADFSVFQEGHGDNGRIFDLHSGMDSGTYEFDEDEDATSIGWYATDYPLHAVPSHPEVHGHDWPAGTDVTLVIDDDTDPNNGTLYARTKNTDDDPWCGTPCFDLASVFNLQVGQYVTMTDGRVSKTVQVSVLKITEVDYEHDTLRGIADPGSRVAVNIWSQNGLARYVTTQPNGSWEADFSVFGDEDFEQSITDIRPGDNGRAIQLNPGETDDGTLEYWRVARPRPYYIKASPTEDWVHARGWLAGATVTLTVDDPNTPQPVDFTLPTSMVQAPWDPGDQDDFIGIFDLSGVYDLQAGYTITITDGVTSLNTVVTDLTQIRWFESLMGYDAIRVANEQAIVDEFNMTHPDIELLFESASSDGKVVFESGISSGNAPDIVGLIGWGAASDFHGQWLDLEPLIQSSGYDTSVFDAVALESYQTDEGQVALPFALYPSAVFYQRAMFDAAGLNYPPANYGDPYEWPDGTQTLWNFDTLTQVAKLLTLDANGRNATEAGFERNNIVQYGYVPQWQHPKEMASYWKADDMYDGTPGNYTAVILGEWSSVWEWYYNGMWGAEPFIPTSSEIGNLGGGNAFDSGKVAMAISHTWITCCIGNAGSNWDLATLPSYNGNVHNPIHADTFRIWKGTQHATEAFEVLTYLLGDDSQALLDLWSGGAAVSARTADQGTFLTSREANYPWVTNWDVMVDGLQYIEKPNQEEFMPNQTEAWNRMQTFGDLLSNQGDLNINQEIVTLQNDLTSIFNYGFVPNNPFVITFPENDAVESWEWPDETAVHLVIDDPLTIQSPDFEQDRVMAVTTWGDPRTYVRFEFAGEYDLKVGDIVTVTDGVTPRTHVVLNLSVTEVNPTTNTITGQADPGADVVVWPHGFDQVATVYRTAGGDGIWQADFSGLFDLVTGTGGRSQILDEAGNSTAVDWNVPNPRISVRLDGNNVTGYEWPLETDIALTIDNPATTYIPVDYYATGQMAQTSWGETIVYFDLNGLYDIKPSDTVSLQGGGYTRTHTVFDGLSFVSADIDTDTVTGTASDGASIQVNQCNGSGCADRYLENVTGGTWVVDFSVEGPRNDEKVLRDLQPGVSGEIWQFDEIGNSTVRNWHVPNPNIYARANDNRIEGNDWPLGETVNVEIDDPSTPQNPDYSNSVIVGVADWNPNLIMFGLDLINYDLKVGDIVTTTQGNTIKQLVVSNLMITNVDLDVDTVYGIAEHNQLVNIWTCWQNNPCINRDETADQNGNWSTNFAVPGEQDWENETADLRAGLWVDSSVNDEDGDQTMFGWNVINPRIEVMEYADRIALVDWPAGQAVHVSIGDVSSPDHEQDFTPFQDRSYYEFFTTYDIKTGDVVTATNGTITKTLEVAILHATGIDSNNGIVSGVATPNSQFDVSVWGDHFDVNPLDFSVSVDSSGNWSADYSDIPGNLLPWTWVIKGEMRQSDYDGDVTIANWHNHWSVLEVWMNEAELRAFDWELGTTLTFTVDDPTTYPPVDFTETVQTTPLTWMDHGAATVSVSGQIDLRPGMIVSVTDGTTTKSTVIQDIGFAKLDSVNDLAEGFAPANAELDIAISKEYWSHRYFSAGADGRWIVDYKEPDAGGRTLDLEPGDQFDGLLMRDDEFDSTAISGYVPNPAFGARPSDDRVEGWQWQLGATVTVEVDDPATAEPIDFTGQTDVYLPDWNPNETRFDLSLNGEYDLKPGDIVTVTDGFTTKMHVVTDFAFDEINPATDMVSGHASPNSQVNVWACDNNTCVNREEKANQSGNWQSNFSIPGELDWEQDTINIEAGTWVDSSQNDEDGDGTYFGRNAGSTITGTAYLIDIAPENAVPGVMIEACNTDNFCRTGLTDGNGNYWISGLPAGAYTLRAIPPGTNLPGSLGPVDISYDEILSGQDITVPAPPLPPPPDAIEPAHTGGGTIVVYWMDDLTLTTNACTDGTASFELSVLEDGYVVTGAMTETPTGSGTYKATIPSLYPHHGVTEIVYTFNCPDGDTVETPFFIYIDPSGVVKDTDGNPIADATVTLLYADNPDGPFTEVPNDSTIMSPSNRNNPDTTTANGEFGWDVVAGYYKVRVEKAGCFSPDNPAQGFVESAVLTIPPPVTDLELTLKCQRPPSASAGGPYTVAWGAVFTLDASASSDPEAGPLTYKWDIDNDGEYDDTSGVIVTTSFDQVGVHTVGLLVTDDGGLTDTDTATVTVLPWTLKGFYQPVDMNGVYNTVKGGSTVPLKFEVFAGAIELTDITDVKSLTYAQTACDTNAITDEIETIATGSTELRYTGGQFIYNWKTPKTPGQCFRVTMTTLDGSSLVAYFKLK